jgi:inosose dehydratase
VPERNTNRRRNCSATTCERPAKKESMSSVMRLANAPCSWGVLEFGLTGEVATWDRVLDEIAATGYAGTELGDWGFMPTDPVPLRSELARRGLELVGGFVPVALSDPDALAPGVDVALRTARLLAETGGDRALLVLADNNGTVPERTLNAGRITPAMGLDEAGWAVFARGAAEIARAILAETGLRTVFHHHCGGYVETPGEIERLMSLTDPDLLGLCLDAGHAMYGGGDPLALLAQYGSRVWHVHLKDLEPTIAASAGREGWDYFRAVAHGVFCELGHGAVPFPALLSVLQSISYDGWMVVEQDVLPSMGSPRASAQRNREYLGRLGV